jgi:cytochrome c-type biogenesis protein
VSGGVTHLVLSGPLILAVPVAAAAGAVTFLSPCVLPLVPGYLSYVTGMTGADAQESAAAEPALVASAARPVSAPAGVAVKEAPPREAPPREAPPREAPPREAPARDAPAREARPRRAPVRDAPVRGTAASEAAPPGAAAGGGRRPARWAARTPARRRAMAGTVLFVIGFSAVFASEGAAFGDLGSVLRYHSAGLTQALGALTIVLGLLFAGAFDRFPITGRIIRPSLRPRAGLAGAPLLGALFGLGWTPCIGPTLSVVLTLAATSGTAVRGAILMFAYSLGLGIPFLVVALAFQRSMTAFAFAKRHARLIARAGGAMLVAVGVLEVTGAWTIALNWLQTHWVAGYQSGF